MSNLVPPFDLTHGQVLWALARGAEPSQALRDEVRYFRQLGVPFTEDEQGTGRGNKLRYSFEQLIELGIVTFAKQRGAKAQAAADYVTQNRKMLRKLFKDTFMEMPSEALKASWVKSRGREIPLMAEEIHLRMHDRSQEKPGKIEMLSQAELMEHFSKTNPDQLPFFAMMVERMPGDETQLLVPLKKVMLELVAWASEAPVFRTGPQ